jgi:hypothetical protein
MKINRSIRPLVAVIGAIALLSPFYFNPSTVKNDPNHRLAGDRRVLEVDDSDSLVSTTLSVVANPNSPPISTADHQKLTAMLFSARELMGKANQFIHTDAEKAKEFVALATAKFREAKEHLARQRSMEEAKSNLRKTPESEEEETGEEIDEKRSEMDVKDVNMDVSRQMYETYVTFPECEHRLFADCLRIINDDLKKLELGSIEFVVHEKRNANQEGYNKVVIITNPEADQVDGRLHDGIVSYPFMWDDYLEGPHLLSVDGKWNCQGITPEECCQAVKESAPNPDSKGNNIECHIFVPFGGVGNPKRSDRVFINLSPDGRVHEAPKIQ